MEEEEKPSTKIFGGEVERVINIKLDNSIPFTPVDDIEARLYGEIVDGLREANANEKTNNIIRKRLEKSLKNDEGKGRF